MLSNSSMCSKSERANNISKITDTLSIATKQYDLKDIASKNLSEYNNKKRPRSDDEKMNRSTIALASTVSSIIAPPVGITIGTILLVSEAIETYHHIATPIQIEINNNITKSLSQNKSITDDMIRDVIFDRCVNLIP